MAYPYILQGNTPARASEVMANFDWIASLIGGGSTPGRITTTAELQVGARGAALITGAADTGPDKYAFVQLGWNADFNKVGNDWVYARFINNKGASSIRAGDSNVTVSVTSNKTDNLNNVLKPVTKWVATEGEDYIYIPNDWHVKNTDSTSGWLDTYRLDLVLFENPPMVFNGQTIAASANAPYRSVRKGSTYGVPAVAKAILVNVEAACSVGSGARIKVYQDRGGSTETSRAAVDGTVVTASSTVNDRVQTDFVRPPRPDLNGSSGGQTGATPTPSGGATGVAGSARWGFTVAGVPGYWMAGTGTVPLGRTNRAGQFTVEITSAVERLSMYIAGYYV